MSASPAIAVSISDAPPLFPGLYAYQEKDREVFFGRDAEIKALYGLIKSNTVTIVFGKSGTGKTSLLNAGIFPKLRDDDCFPFRIRLAFGNDSPPLMQQIIQVIKEQVNDYGFRITPFSNEETLWEFFHREQLWRIVTPVLVFDQFEEIFTLAGKHPERKGEQEILIAELADLIENTIPEKVKDQYLNKQKAVGFDYKEQKAKVVIAFREDYLPEMEGLTKDIPSVKHSRFRLKAMSGKQAREVIIMTWGEKTISKAGAATIVSFLTSDAEKKTDPDLVQIEPSLLNQVCAYLDKERLKKHLDKISDDFLQPYSEGATISAIYQDAIDESNKETARNGTNPAQNIGHFVEEKLITEEGYRIKYSVAKISEDIIPGVDVLRRKYFIREEGKAIELTHDVIAAIVKQDRDTRRTALAAAIADKKAKRKAVRIVVVAALAALIFCAASTIYYKLTEKASEEKLASLKKQISEVESRIQADSVNIRLASVKAAQATENIKDAAAKGKIDTASVHVLLAANIDKAEAEKDINRASTEKAQLKTQVAQLKPEKTQRQHANDITQAKNASTVPRQAYQTPRVGTYSDNVSNSTGVNPYFEGFKGIINGLAGYRKTAPDEFSDGIKAIANAAKNLDGSKSEADKAAFRTCEEQINRFPKDLIHNPSKVPDENLRSLMSVAKRNIELKEQLGY